MSYLSLDEPVIFWNAGPLVELQSQLSYGSNKSYDFIDFSGFLIVRVGREFS